MARQSEERNTGGLGGLMEELPTDQLMDQARELVSALGERAMAVATDKVGDLTDRLVGFAENGGSSDGGGDGEGGGGPSMAKSLLGVGAAGVKAVAGKLGGKGGGGGSGKKTKATNIVEDIEVGVPVRVAYNQWTQFQDFPKYTKRLESVDQKSDEKLTWKAGIFLSHRTWESTIVEQVPDERIVWRSKGEKGSADGTVTFHEIAPNLTKILLVLEYHPQGLFERTGNLWRAQGRRARLELKHFRRHVMTQTILDPDGVEGWRGEIRDGEVVRSHEDALEEEEQDRDETSEDEYDGAEDEGEPEDTDAEEPEDTDDEDVEGDEEADEPEEPEDSDDEGDEGDEGDEEEWPEDEYEDEDGGDEDDEDEEEWGEEPEDEYEDEGDEDEDEPVRRRSRRVPAGSR